MSGCSISVVRLLWEQIGRVRFSAPRHWAQPEAWDASVEILIRNLDRPSSILGTPTNILTRSVGHFCGNFRKKFRYNWVQYILHSLGGKSWYSYFAHSFEYRQSSILGTPNEVRVRRQTTLPASGIEQRSYVLQACKTIELVPRPN